MADPIRLLLARRQLALKLKREQGSPHLETINDTNMLIKLVKLQVESLGVNCPAATVILPTDKILKLLPLELKPKKQLTASFAVTFDCPSVSGHEHFSYLATIDHSALDGQADVDPGDDMCPRSVIPPYVIDPYPDGTIKDKGCGAKKPDGTYGADIVTEVIRK